jgi:hypothetical protein
LAYVTVKTANPPVSGVAAYDVNVLSKLPKYDHLRNEEYCAENFVSEVSDILDHVPKLTSGLKCMYFRDVLRNCQQFRAD